MERFLTMVVEGAAAGVPEIDAAAYKEFKATISNMARRLRDRLPDEEKLALIKLILQEFEGYRAESERAIRESTGNWRSLVTLLTQSLFDSMGLTSSSEGASSLISRIANLSTSSEIETFREQLADFLRLGGDDEGEVNASTLRRTDLSTANDNPSGLPGGGAAIEHVKRLMDKRINGFIVIFRIGSLEVIQERYGREAVEDCLMGISAYITASLRKDDAVYHWSDSSLLAILQSAFSEKVVSTAMRRVIDNNRDISIHIGDRWVMLRAQLEFEITPISQLRSAEDLYRIAKPARRALRGR